MCVQSNSSEMYVRILTITCLGTTLPPHFIQAVSYLFVRTFYLFYSTAYSSHRRFTSAQVLETCHAAGMTLETCLWLSMNMKIVELAIIVQVPEAIGKPIAVDVFSHSGSVRHV